MTLNRIAILLFLALTNTAPTLEAKAEKKVSLKTLSKRLQFYSKLKSFEAHFEQTKTLKDLGLSLNSKGRLSVLGPHRVNWVIEEPALVQVLIDEKKVEVKTGSGSDAQTQVFSLSDIQSQEGFSSLAQLASWMKLDASSLHEDYEVSDLGREVYKFKPRKTATSLFEYLEMTLAKIGYLKKVKIFEKSGDLLEIQFSDPKPIKINSKK